MRILVRCIICRIVRSTGSLTPVVLERFMHFCRRLPLEGASFDVMKSNRSAVPCFAEEASTRQAPCVCARNA